MLAEIVDIVIGVDTHKHTNTAAVVSATTAAAIESATAATDPDGYESLIALADRTPGLRAWAIEGANGYGAGLARFLAGRGEWVIELDRPTRAKRRHGANSDPIDVIRAAREALAREHLAEPRADGERAALSVRLAARRLAVDAATFWTTAVLDQSWQRRCCARGRIRAGFVATPRSRCSPAPHPSQHCQA